MRKLTEFLTESKTDDAMEALAGLGGNGWRDLGELLRDRKTIDKGTVIDELWVDDDIADEVAKLIKKLAKDIDSIETYDWGNISPDIDINDALEQMGESPLNGTGVYFTYDGDDGDWTVIYYKKNSRDLDKLAAMIKSNPSVLAFEYF